VAVGLTGVAGEAFTDTVTLAQVVLLQPVEMFRARAKKVFVVRGLTTGLAPPGTGVPPQTSVNHSMDTPRPSGTVADRVEDSPWQIVEGVAVGARGGAGVGLTVRVTLAQVALEQLPVVFLALA